MLNLPQLAKFFRTSFRVLLDVLTVFRTGLRSRGALAAENLFLRKQLALYLERKKRPRRATDAVRFTMALLARFFEWRPALTIVKPDTLIRWHRKGFRLFWKWKSRSGRPRIPQELRQLIAKMVRSNPSWGEERIASQLLLKIGIQISPRTVRRYMPDQPRRKQSTQSWMTLVRNHAKSIIACDFFVVVTATFRLVYVFIVMEIGTRRIRHLNVTKHPNAEWTMLRFRECLTGEERYRFVIHDRDAIYSKDVDLLLKATGLQILKTPAQSPQAGSPVRTILKNWVIHYNRGRPHSSLGPGIPEGVTSASISSDGRHQIPRRHRVIAKPVLGGLHHEYGLEKIAA